jgi:hypothetical protein
LASQSRQLLARFAGNTIHARLGYFRANVRASKERRRLIREADALLHFLRQSGCTFHPCGSLVRNPVPMGIAYRYDIHVRDIPGSRFFADFHRKQNVPATFFLFWDYSPIERRHLRDYRALGRRLTEPSEMGLHDSPVDAFLIKTRFDGNRRVFAKWTDSGDAQRWLGELASNPRQLDRLNEAVLEDFLVRVRETRRHFGNFSLIAPHGSELWQNMRKKLPSLDVSLARAAQSLRARFWLTPERLAAADLEICVNPSSEWSEITDEGGKIVKMSQMLRNRVQAKSSAVQLLLHPYTWTGGNRDAELSQLLSFDAAASAAAR